MAVRAWFAGLLVLLAAARFCHLGILWTEETLPLAAAQQVLAGDTLYRDVWFDKPPLTAAAYLLWGAETGWVLRLAGALHALLAAMLAWAFARAHWGEREAWLASGLMAFSLTFYLPSAVIPLASDLWMLLPHLAAVWLAVKNRPLLSGVLAGAGFLFNPKALFVLAICLWWRREHWKWVAGGFALSNAVFLVWLVGRGATVAYLREVWELGFYYSRDTFVEEALENGLERTLNWMGFHAALLAGAAWFWFKDRGRQRIDFAIWAGLSLLAVASGWRFFPRYYFQLLPVLVLAGSRGLALLGWPRFLVLLLLVIPLARFGPRYVVLAQDLIAGREHRWSDIAMDQDSRRAADLLRPWVRSGETLFVWGYRPELYVYTGLPAGSRFLESQPLDGVLADRHLFDSAPSLPESFTEAHRRELAGTRPTYLADGLSLYNPNLAITRYPELTEWFDDYVEMARTEFTVIYRRKPGR